MHHNCTHKQRLFIQEYLIDFNATQAAIRAGYSPRTARQSGSENLSKPVIIQGIEEAIQLRSERVQLVADEVLAELKILIKTPISGKLNRSIKLRAIELGMKHLGMI